jgi:hypothetical protein
LLREGEVLSVPMPPAPPIAPHELDTDRAPGWLVSSGRHTGALPD